MKRIIPIALSLLLLCGCAAPADQTKGDTSDPPKQTEESTPSTYPTLFEELPVKEGAIAPLYASDAFYQRTVEEITPYDGDFLVRYTNLNGDNMWDWIFGKTGRIVNMIDANEEIADVSVIRPGHLRVTTTGISNITPQKALPRTYEVMALGTADGMTYNENGEWISTAAEELPNWISVSDGTYAGFVDGKGDPDPGERYAQLYDARVDVDGLSFSFIPSGVPQRYLSFFSGATTPPSYETSFDEESRLFTIRLYNTCLESGEGNDLGKDFGEVNPAYGIEYPYSFPAGSLGRDNRFVKGASITQDGEDLVILMTLSEYAAFYTVESGNLAENLIPTLRFVFNEQSGT